MEELIFGILRYSISTKELGKGGGRANSYSIQNTTLTFLSVAQGT